MPPSKYASTLGFAGVISGSLLVALDAVALSPSLPAIQDALQATTIQTYWASVAYTLGAATFLPLFPSVSDALGRKPITLATLTLFLIGTLVCGTASNVNALLVGRVFQGIGGGGIIGMMYVVMTDLFELRWRPKALAINSMAWAMGTAVGPIMGGGFSTHVSWRWIFWIALPIIGVALSLVAFFLDVPRDTERHPATWLQALHWRNLDYTGAFLVVASLSSFLIPITWAGTMYRWDSPHTLVPMLLGVCGFAGFVTFEVFVPKHPILPIAILNDRTVVISLMHIFILGLVQFGLVFYLPLYYQIVKGYSPLISGVALLPETLLASPMSVVTGMVISKTGMYKRTIQIGWIIMALGAGLLVQLDRSSSIVEWVFLNIPAGIGIGILIPATVIATQAPVEEVYAATASNLAAFVRAVGQTIGVAASNAIMSNGLKSGLLNTASHELQAKVELIVENFASPKLLLSLQWSDTLRTELTSAYVKGLDGVWWFLFAVSCCGLLMSLFIRDCSLDRAPPDDFQKDIATKGNGSEDGAKAEAA